MRPGTLLSVIGLLLALVPGLAAQDDDVTTFTEAVVGPVTRINPLFAPVNPVDRDISALIFDGLTQINRFGEIVPALAEEWAVSSDGTEYVFELRDDVIWQDGEPFTVDDVAYTLSLLRDPAFPGPVSLSRFWRTVEIQPINDTLIRFRLAQPLASFPEALRIGILPEHALRGTDAAGLLTHPFNLSPVGTGPYQLESILTDGQQIREVNLRVSPNYRAQPGVDDPYPIERLRFRVYDSFADVLDALASRQADGYAARNRQERIALSGTDLVIAQTVMPTVGMMIFNWADDDVAFFRELRVREALVTGLNRASLVDRNLFNQAILADSPLPRLSWAYNYGDTLGAEWTYDLAAARDEIANYAVRLQRADDGDEDTQDAADDAAEPTPVASGPVLSFSILVPDDPSLVSLVQEVATQWSQLNIAVTVEPEDPATYTARLTSGDFDTALIELSKAGNPDPDVYAFWHQGQYPDGQNYGGVDDNAISEALERARRDPNGANRKILYDRFQRAFIERSIAIPLYYPLFTYAVNPAVDGVQLGFISDSSDRFATIGTWRFAG